jgi:hypothetical protein
MRQVYQLCFRAFINKQNLNSRFSSYLGLLFFNPPNIYHLSSTNLTQLLSVPCHQSPDFSYNSDKLSTTQHLNISFSPALAFTPWLGEMASAKFSKSCIIPKPCHIRLCTTHRPGALLKIET